jgi:hypothetical protein
MCVLTCVRIAEAGNFLSFVDVLLMLVSKVQNFRPIIMSSF